MIGATGLELRAAITAVLGRGRVAGPVRRHLAELSATSEWRVRYFVRCACVNRSKELSVKKTET